MDQAHPPKHRNTQSCAPPLAEIVGLELQDIDMENDLIHIRPNSIRRLKTRNSKRTLPLVGYAKMAMELALQNILKYI